MTEKHICIDIETLSTKSNAAILSIGAVIFDPYAENMDQVEAFYKKVSYDSCENAGLVVDDSTMAWWAKQEQTLIDDTFNDDGREDLIQVLKDLNVFCRGGTHFWAKSPSFDCVILETVAGLVNLGVPWSYPQTRDCRTIYDLADPELPKQTVHSALEDAYNQAKGVQTVYKKLNIKPKS